MCPRTHDLGWGAMGISPSRGRRPLSERGAQETIAHVASLRRAITISGMTDHDPSDSAITIAGIPTYREGQRDGPDVTLQSCHPDLHTMPKPG
jgi:hypothetical protein